MVISRMSMNVKKVLHQGVKVSRLLRILERTWCGIPLCRMVMGGTMQNGRRKPSKVAGMEKAAKPLNASVTPSKPNGLSTNTLCFYPPTLSWQWPILIKSSSSGMGTRSRSGVPSFAEHLPKMLVECKMPGKPKVKKVLRNRCLSSSVWVREATMRMEHISMGFRPLENDWKLYIGLNCWLTIPVTY